MVQVVGVDQTADFFGARTDCLQPGDALNGPVAAGWQSTVDGFFQSSAGRDLKEFLAGRLAAGARIYPPQPLRALELTPPGAVHTVIVGQDPYHGAGQAEGLAFSVAAGVRPPPSLRNIFKEVERDIGPASPQFPVTRGSLLPWAAQGVLLLNTCLTVEEGRPASHAGQGWEVLTDAVICAVSASSQPVVFMLWGAHAQSKRALVDASRHLVLEANHPSPLSALRAPIPFVGSRHFSKALAWRGTHCKNFMA